MAAGNTNLPDELLAQVEAAARAQNRTADELVCEAVQRYIDDQKWRRILNRSTRRSKAKGLSENDVPLLVEEVRAENRARGR